MRCTARPRNAQIVTDMRKIAIVDQNALGKLGHYLHYTHHVALEAAPYFDYTEIWCRADCHEMESLGFPVTKVFQTSWADVQFKDKESDLANKVTELVAARNFLQGDVVFIHSIGVRELAAFVEHFRDVQYSGPTIIALLRYDPLLVSDDLTVLGPVLSELRARKFSLVFISDTERLVSLYEARLGAYVHLVPVPVDTQKILPQKQPDKAGGPLCFCYMGDARSEKNYHRLPEAVAALRQGYLDTGKISFKLQSNFNSPMGDRGYEEVRQTLNAYPEAMVRLIYGPYDEDSYIQHLLEADVILLPYHSGQYANRSSGILLEAIALAKPVIVTEGSWMATQVDASHAVTIASVDNLADGIVMAYENYERLRQGAWEKRETVLRENSYGALLAKVVEIANLQNGRG